MTRPCVIAGGGLSGLALAWQLERRGIEALVVDSDGRTGGKLRSERVDGFLCEWGPASFSARDREVQDLVSALGLDDRRLHGGAAARRRCVLVDGRVEPLPGSPMAFLRTPILGWTGKLRALCDLLLPRGGAGQGADESVAAFGRRRLGRQGAERLLYPIASGLYAGDAERISLPSAFGWIAGLERSRRSFLLGMMHLQQAGEEPGSALVSFPEGVEELVKALDRSLRQPPRLGAEVGRVESSGGLWRLHAREQGVETEIDARVAVLAMPSHAASPAVQGLDPELAGTLAAVAYVPVALAHLGYPTESLHRPLDTYGFLVPPGEHEHLLGGIFASAMFPSHAPAGRSLMSIRLGGARHPEMAALDDERLAALAAESMSSLLRLPGTPPFWQVRRHALALPQYRVGHRTIVEGVDAAEARHPGLFFTGNAYRGLGVSDCIRNAIPLAERIARHLEQH